MTKRREPIETELSSSVIYPSCLFSLEKDELLPYERFAYNVLGVGVEALHRRGLPAHIIVDFTGLLCGCSAWSINASVSCERDSDGQPSLFRITTPELAPAIFYMFSSVVVSEFFDEEGFKAFRINPRKLGERIRYFISGASVGVRMYRERGLGPAIRAGYDHFGLTIMDLQDFIDDYDLLTKQIAFHEVAHAYIGQFKRKQTTGMERQAFELIADLVATRWFYNAMVRNTPNTDEYRRFRGMDTYADTILANAVMTTRSQLANLMLSAIAGAQCTKGTLSLAASRTHPPGLQRHDLQHLFLLTLIASDFSDILSEEGLSTVQQDWHEKMDVLASSGMLPLEAVKLMLDLSQCEVIEVTADLIEELQIPELMKIIEDLRVTRENLSEFLKFRNIRP